jgi:hypothetical protein
MLHLSAVAVDYIFDRFCNSIVRSEAMSFSKKILKIRKAVEHRPVNVKSKEYRNFLLANLKEISNLASDHPNIDLTPENSHFEKELNGFSNQENEY